ncbi:hypothetical protein ONZ51_g11295 [Trametes cubensis]|uniref:Uncharacterized protein n=1 Tax=Trametes cubensis TaxID=1111947 RepID=A0AAD7X469_9APHY|nr:hypothetical protein ONZ51_g11295 [Trametes cubensis]
MEAVPRRHRLPRHHLHLTRPTLNPPAKLPIQKLKPVKHLDPSHPALSAHLHRAQLDAPRDPHRWHGAACGAAAIVPPHHPNTRGQEDGKDGKDEDSEVDERKDEEGHIGSHRTRLRRASPCGAAALERRGLTRTENHGRREGEGAKLQREGEDEAEDDKGTKGQGRVGKAGRRRRSCETEQ